MERVPALVLLLGRLLGLTETQTAWRWRRLRERAARLAAWGMRPARVAQRAQATLATEAGPARAPVQVRCPHCQALQVASDLRCSACGKTMVTRIGRALRDWSRSIPPAVSATLILTALPVAVYAVMSLRYPTHALTSWSSAELVRHGGLLHDTPSVLAAPWRLGTAMLLHLGVMHLVMNTLAVLQVGALVEEMFGRGKTLFWYVVTGIGANLVSWAWLAENALSAGASGAIMGLCGMAMVVGHRLGPGQGFSVRNAMWRWAAITVGFGYFIGADNAAHIGGFTLGALVGLLQSPVRLLRTQNTGAAALMGLVGGALVLAFTALAIR